MARAALAKKAEEVVILDMRGLTSLTDYFVISSGLSGRQTQAISDEILDQLKQVNSPVKHVEGYQEGEWILIDGIDVIVHVFKLSARHFYDLESLWADAPKIRIK